MLGLILRRPVSVWIAALGLVVLGAFSFWRLPLSLLPTLERPRLKVIMKDADRSRTELLQQLVVPLERRFQTLDGVVDVLATLNDGEAVVILETEWQTDVDRLRIEAERRLVEVSSSSLDELSVELDAGESSPILQVAVLGGRAHQRTEAAEKVLVPELGRLPGAGELRLYGTSYRRVVVEPRAADLAVRGLTATDVADALASVGLNQPLGRVREGALLRPLIVRRSVERLDDLVRLPLPADDGAGLIRLGDVADVTLQEVPENGSFRYDGREGLLIEVYRAPGANAVQLAREGRRAVLEAAERSGHLDVRLMADRSVEVVASLRHLGEAGLLGLLLGTVILRFMLGSWRPTLALAVVVPVSIVAAFSAFYFFGVSLDIVSLAGLALAAGMLVDNSIVVLESISATAAQGADDPVEEGTRQIALPLVAGFLTTAVVFLPLIYLKGLARAFFGVQAFAIVSTLLISLALSLTLTPILSRPGSGSASPGRSPGRALYEKLLRRIAARPGLWATVLISVVSAGAAISLPLLRAELLPPGASRGLGVEAHLPNGLGLEEATRRLRLLEDAVVADPDILRLHWTYRGRADGRRDLVTSTAWASAEPELVEGAVVAEVAERVRRAASRVPGLAVEVEARRGAVTSVVERGAQGLALELSASTAERLGALRARTESYLREHGINVRAVLRDGSAVDGPAATSEALALTWDPMQIALLGTDPEALRRQVSYALGSLEVGRSSIEGTEPGIHMLPMRTGALTQTPLQATHGKWVPLGAVAQVEGLRTDPLTERRNGRLTASLALDLGLGEAPRLEALLAALPLAADERAELSGEVRETRRSFEQLRLALALALVLVFLTVAALYESLAMPLVVMVTVPVAAIGGLVALAGTGQSLNVMSFLGLILLSGIVVNNAIVLVHRAEQIAVHEPDARTAMQRAASERYRPILMTTITTLLGMIPLALLGGDGLELRRALATTVSGGLVTSWIAALLLVPALYLLIARRPARDGELP